MGGVCDGKGRRLIDWEESVIVRGGAFLIGVSLWVGGAWTGGRGWYGWEGGVC